jgi:hypothetical protein
MPIRLSHPRKALIRTPERFTSSKFRSSPQRQQTSCWRDLASAKSYHRESPTADSGIATTDAKATLTQLSNLNASLAVLGLSQSQITVIDRLAQLIKDFNPAAFSDIVNQLELLAQATSPQTAPKANAATTTATNQAAAPTSPNPAVTGSFTLQELSVQFSSIDGTERGGNGRRLGNGEA